MAYATVISLDQTIQRLLDPPPDRISVSSSAQTKLKGARKLVKSLKRVLTSYDRSCEFMNKNLNIAFLTDKWEDLNLKMAVLGDKRGRSRNSLDALDDQIRDTVHTYEDVIDFHISDKFLSLREMQSSWRRSSPILFLDLKNDVVRRGIKSFSKAAEKLEEKYRGELEDLMSSEEDDVVPQSYTDFGVEEMVRFSNNFAEIKEQVLWKIRPADFGVFSILGVAGTGRTAAARSTFKSLLLEDDDYLECGAWVTVGQGCKIKEIIATIISQINNSESGDETEELGEENLYERLEGKRYMIVLDDVRDARVWGELRSAFPEEENGSFVLVSTEVREVALATNSLRVFEMTVFDERESWAILEEGIFGEESCPLELEEAGKKIAKCCCMDGVDLFYMACLRMHKEIRLVRCRIVLE